MKQHTASGNFFSINNFKELKAKVLNWSKQFSTFCFLDNHQYQIEPHSMECLLAAGIRRSIKADAGTALSSLQEFRNKRPSWLFGHLGYDLKNEIEALQSKKHSAIEFPDLFFFEPEILLKFNEKEMIIYAEDADDIYQQLLATSSEIGQHKSPVEIFSRINKDEYCSVIEKLRQHILRGDCYEINFCQEFFAENSQIDPVIIYTLLSKESPNPFSALYKMDDQWLICASPERYLRKEGNRLLSQPIKGTARRVINDKEKDLQNHYALQHSEKDRAENVMVVDLVRNDLAKVCEEGSVKVDELYGVYPFPQVYQMISTVSGVQASDSDFTAIIRATFPMGSMTGAPKKRVMELIEMYETNKRGIFSGAVGYISPAGDFDFNVVIRSIMYNAATRYVSCMVGSGITFYSEPIKEWEECLLKAAAIKKVLSAI